MSTIQFSTKLFTVNSSTILHLPKEESAKLPSRGMVLVKGTLNSIPFCFPLEPDGKGSHWVSIEELLGKNADFKAGDTVKVELESSKEWPEPDVQKDILTALQKAPDQYELWNKITPMARWDWIRWIRATKNPATRSHRIEVAISKLSKGTRRPCCFNRSSCTVPEVSHNGVLLDK